MCQNNYTTKNIKFKQLTYENRLIIEHLYNVQKLNYTQIAKELGFHRTSISREIKQGLIELETSYLPVLKYSSDIAQQNNELNETAKGVNLKIGSNMKLAKYIEREIKRKKSPEVIAFGIRNNKEFNLTLCSKTIYNYIKKDILEIKASDLTYGKYKKKIEHKKETVKSKMSKVGKTIHDRPKNINSREEFGHWEMDLVEGLKSNEEPFLLVLSERKTRNEIIKLLKDKTQNSVIKALNEIEKDIGLRKFKKIFKTITTDNGKEFKDWESIETSKNKKSKRTTQYYADAYCSWQRGTNENINKMIRRFLPKGTSFKNLTKVQVATIEKWINNYPRKILNFKTSNQLYLEELLVV
ncbi:Integrase core domain protein [compost metagenome]